MANPLARARNGDKPEEGGTGGQTGRGMDGAFTFAFDYPPREKSPGLHIGMPGIIKSRWWRCAGLPGALQMDPGEFLRLLVANELPGQPWLRRRKDNRMADRLKAEHIGFTCSDKGMLRRIERAARATGSTVAEFVAHEFAGDVDCYEEDMIIHPATGELLCADDDDLYTRTSHDAVTAPPLDIDRNPPFWKGVDLCSNGSQTLPDSVEVANGEEDEADINAVVDRMRDVLGNPGERKGGE